MEMTRGDCGSGKKMAAAFRKVSSCATVAWRKRNLLRWIGTQGNFGPRSKLTAAGIKITRHARVAWRRENLFGKYWTRNQTEQETPKRRKDGKRMWKGPKFKKKSIRDRGLKEQQRGSERIKDQGDRRPIYVRKKRITSMIYRKTIELETVKRALEISSGLRRIRNWTLWRGRPPPKRKRRSCTE
jgi:hypothetical protein